MIVVEAPEGHDIGESQVSVASFDDMDLDALLENRTAQPKKPAQVSKPTVQPDRPPRSKPATVQTEIKPGENWTNPATKRKQQMVLIAMASLGILLVIAAVSFFIFSQGGKAVVDGGGETVQPDVDNGLLSETKNDPATSIKEPTESLSDDPEAPVEEPKLEEPQMMEAPPIPGIPDDAPAIPGMDSVEPTTPTPEGFGNEENSNPESDNPKPKADASAPEDERARIRAILTKSGTSLQDIRNAASVVQNEFSIGAPKYFFEKPEIENFDATKQKDQILIGVKFDQQKLQSAMHELSAISGLSLTIHAPSIVLAGKEPNPDVQIQVENESTGSVIRKIAESVGLKAIETDTGFNIVASLDDEFVQDSINIALIVENDKEKADLVQLVQQLVWPGTWEADGKEADGNNQPDALPVGNGQPKGSCKVEGTKLVFNHAPAVISEAKKLIEGIKAVNRGDIGGSELLQPMSWFDRGEFAKPFTPKNSMRTSVGKFFRSLSDDYEVKVMADWNALGQIGWSTDAMAPGWIEEKTVGDVVRETAHGLGAGLYFIDNKTVWITTQNSANNIFVLRIYPLSTVGKGLLSPPQISMLLGDALGNQASQPGVSSYILPRQGLMVLRAPQSLHRQVAAVLEELNQ